MTTEEIIQAAMIRTNDILKQNRGTIEENIFHGINDDSTYEQIYAKMILNSVDIATQISVQTTLYLLEEFKILVPKDYEVRHEKPALQLVWDSSKSEN